MKNDENYLILIIEIIILKKWKNNKNNNLDKKFFKNFKKYKITMIIHLN